MKRRESLLLFSGRYRCGILVLPHHHRRDGRIGAAADRGRQCRLAVGCIQRHVQAKRKIAEARDRAKARRLDEACRPTKAPHGKTGRPGAGRLAPCVIEAGCNGVRSREVADRSRRRTYRQSEGATSARNVAEFVLICASRSGSRMVEGRRFRGGQIAGDRGQGEAQPPPNGSPPPTIGTRICSCRSITTRCPTNCSRTGNSRARQAISATASADIRSSSPAESIFQDEPRVRRTHRQANEGAGLQHASNILEPIMGRYQHPLVNRETGVYSYDELTVLRIHPNSGRFARGGLDHQPR